jgi:hypothetical protein
MKKSVWIVSAVLTLASGICLADSPDQKVVPQNVQSAATQAPAMQVAKEDISKMKTFVIYQDKGYFKNHYAPSGWMGDAGDLKVDLGCMTAPHSGQTCIKITYTAAMSKNAGWAGMYWQQPVNNWGDNKKGGYKLTGMKKLTFWAKGAVGGEVVSEFKMGGISGEFGDSDSKSLGPVTLTKEWKQYTIDLANADLSNIIGGFCWSASKDDNPQGFIIYLDDIQYEQ